jgi:hypothetical protein
VLRKDLVMVTWEGGLKEALVMDEILCRPRTLLFSEEWGYDLYEQKKIKRLVSWFDNFFYHMHNSNKMVACTFCRIKGLKHIKLGCILRKWKKAMEPPIMIRRPKDRILELVM